jgi:GAF domain-containing protein/HAMP domain-containing protein
MQAFIEKNQDVSDKDKRAKNAFNISIATGVIFILIAASVVVINRAVRFDLSLSLMLLTVVVSFLSAWQSRRGNSDLGILAVIGALILTIVGRVFVQKGLAIPTGITNVILVSTIAFYALPPNWLERVIGASFITAIATIIIDQYTVGIPTSSSPETGMTIALVLGGIYIFILAVQFPKFNLRTKLITGFLFLSTIPLVVLGWQTYVTSQDILQKQIKASLSESATSTRGSLEDFVSEQFNILTTEASLPNIIDYVSLPKSERKGSEHEGHALNALKTFIKKDPLIISYSLIDADGRDILDTVPSNINSTYQDQVFFTEPLNTQKRYLSNVLFPRKFRNPILYFAVPIFKTKDQVIGVLLATYNAGVLQSTLQAAVENRSSGSEYTFLIDGIYFINLGHSSKPDLLYKSYLNMENATLLDLQSKNILQQGAQEELLVPQLKVVESIRDMGAQTFFQAPSWENNGEPAESAAARVPNTPWIVVASQPVSAITALTQDQTRATVTSSAIIMIIAAIFALLASNLFTTPIVQLTEVAEKISAGNFSQKARSRSNDEIGILGKTLNKMTDEIQGLIGNLEKRVEERTSELGKATTQSEKRARELQTIAEIARYISAEKDLEHLLPLITRIVSEQFGFYHVGIFLLNENKKFAILRAANSPGGQVMLKRQHKLEVGQIGIVGNVTSTGFARIALDTGADAVYFNNPDLPETHSEMALPLTIRGEVIGALDVQSTESNAFTTSDISILSLLADQIAIAIDNVRLLEDSKRALAESQSVFREYVAEAWQSKSSSNIMGYYQTVTGGRVITRKGAEEIDNLLSEEKDTLAVPIQLRGQAIGTLNIRLNNNEEQLTAEQVNIIQSVTERLGLALENARLFEETSTRASRERLVTEITTKIRETNDPQEMIKTAMAELKQALGASRIEVIPKKAAPQTK